jgi:hypothetical protein
VAETALTLPALLVHGPPTMPHSSATTCKQPTSLQRWFLTVAVVGLSCVEQPILPDPGPDPAGTSTTVNVSGTPPGPVMPAPAPAGVSTPGLPEAPPPQPLPPGPTSPPPATAPPATPMPARPPAAPVPTGEAAKCSSEYNLMRVAQANERLHCTLIAGAELLTLQLDFITRRDPVSLKRHASCWVGLPLVDAATASGTGAVSLDPAAVDSLVAAVKQIQPLCTSPGGTLAGMTAGPWMRRILNAPQVAGRLRAEAGTTLDFPSDADEEAHLYLAVSRARRGRIVYNDWPTPGLLVWPRRDPAPTRHPLPSFAEVGETYLAAPGYRTFEQARLALRARLQDELSPVLASLRSAVRAENLSPLVAVGRTDSTLRLAVRGELRSSDGIWLPPEAVKERVAASETVLTDFGWDFGSLRPREIASLFETIGTREFTQLRTAPLREAYGEYLLLSLTVLDLLADEVEVTEFGFPYTLGHHGYLLSKVFPSAAR